MAEIESTTPCGRFQVAVARKDVQAGSDKHLLTLRARYAHPDIPTALTKAEATLGAMMDFLLDNGNTTLEEPVVETVEIVGMDERYSVKVGLAGTAEPSPVPGLHATVEMALVYAARAASPYVA